MEGGITNGRKRVLEGFSKAGNGRPDYQAWLHCKDPEEKVLRSEILRLLTNLDNRASRAAPSGRTTWPGPCWS